MLTAIFGAVLFHDALTPPRIAGIAAMLVGVPGGPELTAWGIVAGRAPGRMGAKIVCRRVVSTVLARLVRANSRGTPPVRVARTSRAMTVRELNAIVSAPRYAANLKPRNPTLRIKGQTTKCEHQVYPPDLLHERAIRNSRQRQRHRVRGRETDPGDRPMADRDLLFWQLGAGSSAFVSANSEFHARRLDLDFARAPGPLHDESLNLLPAGKQFLLPDQAIRPLAAWFRLVFLKYRQSLRASRRTHQLRNGTAEYR